MIKKIDFDLTFKGGHIYVWGIIFEEYGGTANLLGRVIKVYENNKLFTTYIVIIN